MRKGQTTIFVILGIVFIITIGLLLQAYKESLPKTTIAIESDNKPRIKLFVESCLESTIKEGLVMMGYQSQNNPGFEKNQIEEYLKNHLQNNFKNCTQDFSIFKDTGITINHSSYASFVFVKDTSILVQLDYPLTIIEENQEIKLEKFATEISFNYQGRRLAINNLLQILAPIILHSLLSQQTTSGTTTTNNPLTNQLTGISNTIQPTSALSISELTEMAYEQGFTYNLVYDENGELRLFLRFEASGTDPEFTHMIIMPQEPFQEKETFFLHEIPPITYTRTTTMNIQTNSQGVVRYKENSEYVTISPDGRMTISGDIPPGITRVLVKATDERGNTDYAYIIIKR
ncbi:MAG: hypothetical protein KJ583_06175 [Nanoarchaeota archaeon]|nr:hypothetical protein [Nanoarchaeota archaeon]MBU1269817.1 hypothetical protein [Nanoarchaeota archaeon]MBU1604872.1 hypothetical protein [Nanoarchaeota archaeon]MBU2442574.1 hypothetical protein [Nanoarchaeota archaeon]